LYFASLGINFALSFEEMHKNKVEIVERRSNCPLSCTLELIGDKWSLIIIRDMMFFGKSTYNEFLDSAEKISTNILHERLIKLVETGLVRFTGPVKRKKYILTEKGTDLKPVLESLGIYGSKHFKGAKEYLKTQLTQVRGK
jgi:DNA-binding HxlR family transcriptional regulator